MANLYFVDQALTAATRTIELIGDEARHAVQVARVRSGDRFEVSDGNGWRADATVTAADKSRVECAVENPRRDAEPTLRVVLAQALAKGDRDELAVQAATELGVSVVVPWQSERSVSKWVGDKVTKGVARWTAIVREASKQSMRSRIPTVAQPVATAGICATVPDATWIVLDPRGEQTLSTWYASVGKPTAIGIVVGPEGGITDAEIDTLLGLGAISVRLDGPILRTSTAGPAAIAALLALGGAW
jgi:16S rRNA (uracil1498-N3)-methyltransferase